MENYKIHFWVAYTKDRYELPVATGDTCIELAEKLNSYPALISKALNHGVWRYKIVHFIWSEDEYYNTDRTENEEELTEDS